MIDGAQQRDAIWRANARCPSWPSARNHADHCIIDRMSFLEAICTSMMDQSSSLPTMMLCDDGVSL